MLQGTPWLWCYGALGAALACCAGAEALPAASTAAKSVDAARGPIGAAYGRLPLSFEVNRGQAGRRVSFLARGPGWAWLLASNEAVLSSKSGSLRMRLAGASPNRGGESLQQLPGKANYFIGNDPKRWRTKIPTCAKVRFREVYPGVDLIYYGSQGQLEFDVVVSPGADPEAIRLDFSGADGIEPDAEGGLVLHATGGRLRLRRPVVYQEADGARKHVPGRYALLSAHQVGFRVDGYDASKTLFIDPVLVYSTYLGAINSVGNGIAVDSAGAAYVTGATDSTTFAAGGALQPALRGPTDVFVAKLNPEGTALVYATYLGGSDVEVPRGIAVDASGHAYVAGQVNSRDFPTAKAWRPVYAGSSDGFLAKLDPQGSALVYSTYLGGSSIDIAIGIAADAAGNAYVTGETQSANFPVVNALRPGFAGGIYDIFLAKLNPSGSPLYSTFLGGGGSDRGFAVAVDSAGNAYLTGETDSPDFPTVNPAQPGLRGPGLDAFVTKVNAEGSALVYSTYLGGTGSEEGFGIAVDRAGSAYVTGFATGTDFPTFPRQACPGSDAFVTKLTPAGSAIVYSTCLGGRGDDGGRGIAVDAAGNAYVTGRTDSSDFPNTTASVFSGSPGFKSTDSGATWQPLKNGLENFNVRALAIDPQNPSTVYAGTQGGGVFKSVNGGGNWAKLAGVTYPYISCLAVNPQNPAEVYAGGVGVFRSSDGGSTWRLAESGLATLAVNALAIDPQRPSTLYAATQSGEVFKSTDAGVNWSPASAGLPAQLYVTALAVDPRNPATLYAGTPGAGAFKSTDAGGTWSPINAGLDNNIYAFALDPVNPATVYAGARRGVYKSTDGGGRWTTVNSGLVDTFIYALVIDPKDPSKLYAGTSGGGVFKTENGGQNWSAASAGLPTGRIYTLAVDPKTPSTLYAGTLAVSDAFVTKLAPDGGRVLYSMYVGGSGSDEANGIAVDASGDAYLAGTTNSADFPVANAFRTTLGGGSDSFVVKVSDSAVASGLVTSVSAASFQKGAPLAPDSIASAFGVELASSTEVATSVPLPTTLADRKLSVGDSGGTYHPARLFFVSPTQVNFLVPATVSPGPATLTVARGDNRVVATGKIEIQPVAPGLFTANADGQGPAAAVALKVTAGGAQTSQLTFQCGTTPGSCTSLPIDLGAETDQLILLLYGTGIRRFSSPAAISVKIGGQEAPVLGAAAQPQYFGLDQVNVRLPRSLMGRGEVDVLLTVDGKAANSVQVHIK